MQHIADNAHQKIVTVMQGDFSISGDDNVVLSTVLGSCVAVCLFDREHAVGGMNHYLLPGGSDGGSKDVKYGINSMELLINELQKRGANRKNLVAKVFGGASMFESSSDIGRSNVEFGMNFLRNEDIPCVSESTGGKQARRVHFFPATGAAKLMIVPSQEAPPVIPVKPAAPAAPAGEIDLF